MLVLLKAWVTYNVAVKAWLRPRRGEQGGCGGFSGLGRGLCLPRAVEGGASAAWHTGMAGGSWGGIFHGGAGGESRICGDPGSSSPRVGATRGFGWPHYASASYTGSTRWTRQCLVGGEGRRPRRRVGDVRAARWGQRRRPRRPVALRRRGKGRWRWQLSWTTERRLHGGTSC